MFEKRPVIMDGATGTELQRLGMPAGSCTEKWVLENPDKMILLQRAYVSAGSRLIYAPTFGANSINLAKHGIKDDLNIMCRDLVAISREAADGLALVIGDISSTGELVEPYGDMEEDELFSVFARQAEAIERAGVDLFGIETQMYLDEARLAVKAVKAVSSKPIIVSFSCGPTGKTLWGEDLCDVCDELQQLGITAFGVNCCGDLDLLCSILERLHERTQLPLIAKPNAGVPVVKDGRSVYDFPTEKMAEYAIKFHERGARLIGGCCGTTPLHIEAIRRALREKL